jgi:hypothetical protein
MWERWVAMPGLDLRPPHSCHWRVAVTAAVTLLAWAGPAAAQDPCGESAIDQYVECVPTDKGSSAPGTDKEDRTPLSGAVQEAVAEQGGDDAPILTDVATSSRYGAPQRTLKIDRDRDPAARESAASASGGEDTSPGEAVSAAVSAVQSGDAGRLVGLLGALLAIALATLAFAALRQKRRAS